MQVLNRTLGWGKRGIAYEADQRHAEIVIQEMRLEKGTAVVTPGVPEAADEANRRLNSPEWLHSIQGIGGENQSPEP